MAIRFSTSISLMFREYPIEARLERARRAGFEGVEIQFIEEADPPSLGRAARACGIAVALINVGMGDFRAGGPGLSGVPGREAEFRQAVTHALEAAVELGVDRIHLGPSRVPDGIPRERCLETYRSNLEAASELAGDRFDLLIEPINLTDTPTALLFDFDLAAELIREQRSVRFGLQFDIYHAAMLGHDPVGLFAAHRSLVRHVQFSDAPGRHEPGTGAIDFDRVLTSIAASGYQGWVGSEYFPSRPTDETLGWLGPWQERFGR
jgi:hydroxypyruvate isomerase